MYKLNLSSNRGYFHFSKNIREYVNSSIFNSYYLEKGLIESYNKDFVPWNSIYFIKFLEDFVGWTLNQNEDYFTKIQPSETTTIDKYILPLMSFLNWDSYEYGSSVNSNRETTYWHGESCFKPDIVFFENKLDAEKVDKFKKDKNTQKLFVQKNHKIVVEAKKFGLLKPKSNVKDEVKDDFTKDRTPEEQIVLYMDMLHSKYGILTDGGVWKFFHQDFRDKQKYLSFDIGKLCLLILRESKVKKFNIHNIIKSNEQSEIIYLLAFFYNVYSKEALYGDINVVNHLIEYTKKYSNHLEDKMKDRFIMAMNWACNGLAKSLTDKGEDVHKNLDLIQRTAESHLFNIIFFRSLESRSILPYYDDNNDYKKYSVSRSVDEIYSNKFDPSKNFHMQLELFSDFFHQKVERNTTKMCDSLIALYKIVHKGFNEFKINGFRKSLFNELEWDFANKYKIDDQHMINVMFYLSLIPKENGIDNEYQLIPFDFLTPREIGAIYESFLEFKLKISDEDLVWNSSEKMWMSGTSKACNYSKFEMVKKGELFFCPDNIDRKMSGAYYTPDHVVKYIVEKTLDPFCKNKMPEEILKLKICDPAMGSGHFLTASLEYLRDTIIDSCNFLKINLRYSPEVLNNLILSNCLHGCDINPSAVKLSKMSLWLATAQSDSELEDLDDQLVFGDSLEVAKINNHVFNWTENFNEIITNNLGFDVVIGNPPWGASFSDKNLEKLKIAHDDIIVRMIDSYMFFINKSFSILKKKGRIGFIVPDVFFYQIDNWKLRKKLLDNFELVKAIKLGNIFENVNRPSCVFIAYNLLPTEKSKFDYVDLSLEKNINLHSWSGSEVQLNQKEIDKNTDYKIIPTSSNSDSRTLIKKIYKSAPYRLSEYLDLDGIQRGASPDLKEAFIVDKKDIKNHSLESKYLKKTLTGGTQIKRFHIEWDGKYLIYTSRKTPKTEIPNIIKFISKFKDQISCKEVDEGKHPIYSLHRPREEQIYKKKNKILGVITSDKIIVSIDEDEYYPTDGAYLFGVNDKINSMVLVSILNSNLFIYLYQAISQEKGRAMAQVKPTLLGDLPIPEISLEFKKKFISEYVKMKTAIIERNENSILKVQSNINELVYSLFSINKKDILLIENEISTASKKKTKLKKAS